MISRRQFFKASGASAFAIAATTYEADSSGLFVPKKDLITDIKETDYIFDAYPISYEVRMENEIENRAILDYRIIPESMIVQRTGVFTMETYQRLIKEQHYFPDVKRHRITISILE